MKGSGDKVLVTGGAGYIGSHILVELIKENYEPIVVDNFINSSKESLLRVQEITHKNILSYNIDVRNKIALEKIFKENHPIKSVIHLAGLKSVNESVINPVLYYNNNIVGSVILFEVMQKYNCKKIVFSSSATVYGIPEALPIKENAKLSVINPYGRTKLFIEEILNDIYISDNLFSIGVLRYFNPIGAHDSGLIGENPNDIPNNLIPYIAQVAIGKRPYLNIYGSDYPTKDGTGVRDYIHVVDLAKGHVMALQALTKPNLWVVNLGTGKGYSVLEVIDAFEKASKKKIPYKIVEKRHGDVAECYADPSKAYKILNWKATMDINQMCKDVWNWQKNNPNGY